MILNTQSAANVVSGQNLHLYPHLSLNHKDRWGTTEDFTTSFLHFSLFSAALWVLANSRPVHSLMLSSRLFFCLPCFLPSFTVPCKMVLARPDEWGIRPYRFNLHIFTMVRTAPYDRVKSESVMDSDGSLSNRKHLPYL